MSRRFASSENERQLSHAYLIEIIHYDPDTGVFTWLQPKQGRELDAPAGVRRNAGKNNKYERICIDGVQFRAHRLAWFYSYGVWPKDMIDHINLSTLDNRLSNLREATMSENKCNAKSIGNTTGFKGVYLNATTGRPYVARITKNKKYYHLGYFDTPEEAYAARLAAEKFYHGDFALAVA